MKKAKSELNDWARSEYKRSDLGELARGKYTKRLSKVTAGSKRKKPPTTKKPKAA